LREDYGGILKKVESECKATTSRLRSDCKQIANKLRRDNKEMAKQLQAKPKRLESDQFQCDCKAIGD
jgi:hypothetical protein